jgi:hypothetical protein
MWMPEVIGMSLKLCFRAKDKRPQFLINLGKVLHYQNEANSDMIETDVYHYVKVHQEDLIAMTSTDIALIPHILKILNFVPLPEEQPAVSLLHTASNNLARALFVTIGMFQ